MSIKSDVSEIDTFMIKTNKDEFEKICQESSSMAEAARKLGMHFGTFRRHAIKLGCYNANQAGKGVNKPRSTKFLTEDILSGKHPEYQTFKLKTRLLLEGYKEEKCESCGIKDWRGEFLPLELNHIDGNRFNHSLDNLEILCPNCHSQTPSWRGKNIGVASAGLEPAIL